MNPIWTSAWASARRALHVGDRRPPRGRESMWRLVGGELAHLARLVLRPFRRDRS